MQILNLEQHASALEIKQQAERRLRESPYFFLKGVHCGFDGRTLTLRGSVPMEQLRQFAESIVARVEGVEVIDNQVEVFDPMAPFNGQAVRNAG